VPKVLYTIDYAGPQPPSLAEVADRLAVPIDHFDQAFGVVVINPQKHRCAVRIDDSVISEISPENAEGPYADPKIGPFGTPQE
jgi:hypothetical protein